MEKNETLNKQFLKIKSIRTFSRAFEMGLLEDDIILGLDGEIINSTYEDFSKQLTNIKEKKILTIVRQNDCFNTFIYGPLGVVCEQFEGEEKFDFHSFDLKKVLDLNESYTHFEIYVRTNKTAILLNTIPTILASLAPPLWMIQNRLWNFLGISLIFYVILLIVSPWLFFIGWILTSWYVGSSQIDILRHFYRFNNFRLWFSFCEVTEKKAQELARKFNSQVDFDYSYLDPVILDN